MSTEHIVKTPLFPLYSEVSNLLAIWNGIHKSIISGMLKVIFDQCGTPQNPVDWSAPDSWIEERLKGAHKDLAHRIWSESGKTANPRHAYGSYLFINTHELLKTDPHGIYHLTEKGQAFLKQDHAIVRSIDLSEGLPQLLNILAAHSPAQRRDLLDEWGVLLLEYSKFGTQSTIKDTLRRRILNLVERGYISREGNTYTITESGIAYAAGTDGFTVQNPHREVIHAIKKYNDKQIQELRERLAKMDPYCFEALVKDLLEAMDYEDVVVTKQSGDKGIDVAATFQFGITQIREVVQVKRHQGSIPRPVLDQLRGALPYHQAIRGTIITLGKFAKGCKESALYPGAAPITLIDGDMLIDLLLKNDVGVKKKLHALIEVDERYFAKFEPEENLEATN